jgi:prepilin-type processing-associated H-X9-DG protein
VKFPSSANFVRRISREHRSRAFTLAELLAVVAMVILVALSLLPALAKVRPTSFQSICRNNLRQLGAAATMYLGDNGDVFPACASRNTFGFQVSDWIYWRTSLPAYPVQNSLILAGLGKTSTNILRCAGDRDNSARIALAGSDPANGAYNLSYTITSFGVLNGRNIQGMSSIVDSFGGFYPFKSADIRHPSGKIVFAEEQSIYQGPEASSTSIGILNDGRWIPQADILTSRHYGNANVGFGDGHVDTVNWRIGTYVTNSQANL